MTTAETFDVVSYVEKEIDDWRASDGGYTRAAVDVIQEAWIVQRAMERGDIEAVIYWMFDANAMYPVSDAAEIAYRAMTGKE